MGWTSHQRREVRNAWRSFPSSSKVTLMALLDGRYPLLRTWLFGPGADSDVHAAMSASHAEVLIQDLEDFTPPARRDEARALAAGLFARWRAVGARVCVRINSLHDDG